MRLRLLPPYAYYGQPRAGRQITDAIRKHEQVTRADARARALELFERVRVPRAASMPIRTRCPRHARCRRL